MKHKIIIGLLILSPIAKAQKNNTTTNKFVITGESKVAVKFSLPLINDLTVHSIDSIVIYNHLHERKRTIHNIKGILLKDVLEKAGLNESKPKLFSEFYFTCIASDGYKVVFSWNELFNSDMGNQVMIITEEDGKKADTIDDHIAILSPLDKNTGRRYVQNLQEIKVGRVK
ncbi:MAG: molybdopterin-binding protein [Bacteroidetes bacterium]|nr:molybdopterin-binding protein [Bacteroidota bacterium]